MNKDIIYEYENVLLGNKSAISPYFFCQSPEQNERAALTLIKYAVETYLKWSPERLCKGLTWDIIYRLKLETAMRYVIFPPETDAQQDLFVVAAKLYPSMVRVNMREKTLLVYKRVLDGTLYKFPKEFFSNNHGVNRALICLQYALAHNAHFSSTKEMYEFFTAPQGAKFLKDNKLYATSIALYDYPLDYLHEALSSTADGTMNLASRSEFWYHFYKFKLTNNEQIRAMKKDGSFIA